MGDARRSARRRWAALSALLLCASPVVVSCSDGDGDGGAPATVTVAPPAPGVLRFAAVGLPSLDPLAALAVSPSQLVVADLVFDGLTSWDPEAGEAVGALAARWEASDDGRTWTFRLRDDAAFADGTKVTAKDVVATIERAAARRDLLVGFRLDVIEGYAAFVAGESASLAGVRATDATHVRFELAAPYQPLPELLTSPYLGVLSARDAEATTFPAAPNGSGPYGKVLRSAGGVAADPDAVAIEGDAERPIVLGRNDGAGSGAAGVKRIELLPFGADESAYAAYLKGRLDWSPVPGGLADEAARLYGGDLFTPSASTYFFAFDLAADEFADVRFREALSLSIDREDLVEAVLEDAIVADGLVPDGSGTTAGVEVTTTTGRSGTTSESTATATQVVPPETGVCGDPCRFSRRRAKELIAEAFPDGDVPRVAIDTYDDPRERKIASALQGYFQRVGVDAEVRVRAKDEYRSFVTSGDQRLFSFGWVDMAPTPDAHLAPQYLSTSSENVTGFSSPAVDRALRAARAEADPRKRAEAYELIEGAIAEQVPVIPLAELRNHVVVSDRVSGYVARPDGTFVVAELRLRG